MSWDGETSGGLDVETRAKRDRGEDAMPEGVGRTISRLEESAISLEAALDSLTERLDYLLLAEEARPQPGEAAAVREPGSPVRQQAERVHAHLRHLNRRVRELTERIDL